MERLEGLLQYFSLLRQTPQAFNRLDKVSYEIEKELQIKDLNAKTPQQWVFFYCP